MGLVRDPLNPQFDEAPHPARPDARRVHSEAPETASAPGESPFVPPAMAGREPGIAPDVSAETAGTVGPVPATAAAVVRTTRASESLFSRWHGDLVLVIVATVAAFALSAHYDLAETLRRLTGPYEALQLDELPVVMLVAALGLVWFSWRRYRKARLGLRQRQVAEAALAATLEENRRLAKRFMDVQEAERRNLARELHDELGQYLNAIKLDAVAVANHSAQLPFHARARNIIDSVDHVHRVVQVLIRRFRPVALDELGLQAALEHYVHQWRQHLSGTALLLEIEGDLGQCSESTNLAIYRTVQEGLTNISRHARATRVRIRLERGVSGSSGRDEVRLTMEDNGVGVALQARGSGLGLVGMRERAETLGGEFRVSSTPGRGFWLQVAVPVACPEATS